MNIIDLSQLPAPGIVESLNFESIFEANKQLLVSLYPELQRADINAVLQLESEPLVKLLQAFAYRELILRARVNEAAKAVMLSFAVGADLDQIGGNYGVSRLLITPEDSEAVPPVAATWESDEDFRRRIQMSLDGLSVAGPEAAYVYHALSASGLVKDVGVTSPSPGEVVVSILSRSGDGTASEELVSAVEAALSAQDVRPLTDHVTVQSVQVVPYAVAATLYVGDGPDPAVVVDNARAALDVYVKDVSLVGEKVPLSGIYAALHQPGVRRVLLESPVSDVEIADTQAGYCQSVSLAAGVA